MTKTTQVFGIYDTSELAGLAVDELVRNGFEARSITVLPGDDGSGREFAERKHTRLPAIALDGHGRDVPLEGSWGLFDPACGPQEGALSAALAELKVTAEEAESAILEGKVLLSADCVDALAIRCVTDILNTTGALGTGVTAARHSGDAVRGAGAA